MAYAKTEEGHVDLKNNTDHIKNPHPDFRVQDIRYPSADTWINKRDREAANEEAYKLFLARKPISLSLANYSVFDPEYLTGHGYVAVLEHGAYFPKHMVKTVIIQDGE